MRGGVGAVVLSLTTAVAGLRAELPPWTYPDPKAAPEILVVKPTEVVVSEDGGDDRRVNLTVSVKATVREVVKTGSGLKPGDIIVIGYPAFRAKPTRPLVVGGEGTLPVLEKDEAYRVHLKADTSARPAADTAKRFSPLGAPYNAMTQVEKSR